MIISSGCSCGYISYGRAQGRYISFAKLDSDLVCVLKCVYWRLSLQLPSVLLSLIFLSSNHGTLSAEPSRQHYSSASALYLSKKIVLHLRR